MEIVKVQLIERLQGNCWGCAHSLRETESPIRLQQLAVYPNPTNPTHRPRYLPKGTVKQRGSQPLPARGRNCTALLVAARVRSWSRGVRQAAEQPRSSRHWQRARENCFAVCKGMEGGSVISSDIKATRKLLESSFYKSPFEKHLPSP